MGSTVKFIEQEYKAPGEGGGPERVGLKMSKFRGYYELFCGTIFSNRGVLSCANQGFGHISVYLLGYNLCDSPFFANI